MYDDYYRETTTPAIPPPQQQQQNPSRDTRPVFNRDDTITLDRSRQPAYDQPQSDASQQQPNQSPPLTRNGAPVVDEIPPYGSNKQAQQGQKGPLTRENVRANANFGPGPDGYDPVDFQHAMWLLEVCIS